MSNQNFEIIVGGPAFNTDDSPAEIQQQVTGYPIGVESNVAAQIIKTPLIAPKCSENLNQAIQGEKFTHLPNMFLQMARDADENGLPAATLVVPFHENNTAGVLPGQYVSEIHLVIHRMPDDKSVEESVPVPGE